MMNSAEEIIPQMDDAGAEELEPQGVIDRLINIYLEPATLFKYLAVKPDFWTPWIVVGIIMLLMTAFTFPVTYDLGIEYQVQIAQRQGKSDTDIAKLVDQAQKMHTFSMVFALVSAAVTPLIGWLIGGGIVFVISLIQGLEAGFKRIFSVMAYTSLISILGSSIIDKVIKLARGADTIDEWQRSIISLAVLLPVNAHKALVSVLSVVDPFFIWSLVAMAIGLTYANKCRMRSAVVTVIIYAIVIFVLIAGLGFVQQLLTGGAGGGGGGNVTVSA